MKNYGVKNFLRQNALQLSVQGLGLLFLVINLWLANKLYPLVQGISTLDRRVDAIELTQKEDQKLKDDLVPQFRVVQNDIEQIKSDVRDIKNDLRSLLYGGR